MHFRGWKGVPTMGMAGPPNKGSPESMLYVRVDTIWTRILTCQFVGLGQGQLTKKISDSHALYWQQRFTLVLSTPSRRNHKLRLLKVPGVFSRRCHMGYTCVYIYIYILIHIYIYMLIYSNNIYIHLIYGTHNVSAQWLHVPKSTHGAKRCHNAS